MLIIYASYLVYCSNYQHKCKKLKDFKVKAIYWKKAFAISLYPRKCFRGSTDTHLPFASERPPTLLQCALPYFQARESTRAKMLI